MRYTSFTIHEYRGITSSITISVERDALIPIIGINECGKTTILEALCAFDQCNDKQNHGRHLQDTENLFSFQQGTPRVSATVALSLEEFHELIDECLPVWTDDERSFLDSVVEDDERDSDEEAPLAQFRWARVDFDAEAVLQQPPPELDEMGEDDLRTFVTNIQHKQRLSAILATYRSARGIFPGEMTITRDLKKLPILRAFIQPLAVTLSIS